MKKTTTWKDFFKDSKGTFNVFTVISLLAGTTLVTAPLVTRLLGWLVLTNSELTTLTLIFCISALSDYLLAIYINKMPGLNVGNVENVTATSEGSTEPVPEVP